jgi:hypothetical protein
LQETEYNPTLIQTKLKRPPLPVDLVSGPRLKAWLKARCDMHQLLISDEWLEINS